MTWEELIEYIVSNFSGVDTILNNSWILINRFYLYKNGLITYQDNFLVATGRTPDQMYQIITALTETKESK